MSGKLKFKIVFDYTIRMIVCIFLLGLGAFNIYRAEDFMVAIWASIYILFAFYTIYKHTRYILSLVTGKYDITIFYCADKPIHNAGKYASYYLQPVSINGARHHYTRCVGTDGVKVSYWLWVRVKKGDEVLLVCTSKLAKCYHKRYI